MTAAGSKTVSKDVEAGQAVYSPLTLKAYDWFVHGLSNHLLWRCPTSKLRALYDRNVRARHLDIGVGTGYFVDKADWPVQEPDITLMDLNGACLEAASKRIARYKPKTVVANCLEPLPALTPFKSVGLSYLLHCVPGTIGDKAVMFDYLRPVLEPKARVFGATIVQGDAPRSPPAQALMNFYNKKGVFSNGEDTLEALQAELRARFNDVRVELIGAVALFEAEAVVPG